MLTRTVLLVAGLLGLAAAPAVAQNYRPFAPGRTYHYREAAAVAGGADSLFTFRIDSASVSGADSVFYFNRTHSAAPGNFVRRRVNLFGGWQRWNATTGTATFGAAGTTATVEVRTRTAPGATWQFTDSLTAVIQAYSIAVDSSVQLDTLLLIAISDGRLLHLSQRHGLIEGVSFDYYLGHSYATLRPRRVGLLAVPELAPAPMVDLRWEGIWNLQPGDSLNYFASENQEITSPGPGLPLPYSKHEWELIAVRGRHASSNGDTLTFDVTRSIRTTTYDLPWFSGPDTSIYQVGAGQLTVIRSRQLGLTGIRDDDWRQWTENTIAFRHADSLGGRAQFQQRWQPVDAAQIVTFGAGLGTVLAQESVGGAVSYNWTRRLVGFVKNNGTIRWGNMQAPQPLAVPTDVVRLPATLAPNPAPAGTAPTLTFTLDQPQAVSLVLYDAVGRVVWQQAALTLAAGPHQLLVAAGTPLVSGLYRLRLTLADGRQRVLPLVRE